ncbi:hypothetical protein HHL22_13455 [Hymenobacter sp. RP-2-7]|uniref:Uncharacterized protein n=1 Tax=Hymenobacter polaris TaxID=2682546 RepID=A0A7Y0AF50_9BACT|nr:hypothetical protein [Hymenobacter polaris]NML66214.1 hypothetical protein [Hymenobacter polaris]
MPDRLPTDVCLLCKQNLADKRASHIIPKFMTKGMLKPSRPGGGNQGFIMGTYGKRRFAVVQDTPKQDYLFCTRCEARFEKVETYTARKFFSRFRNPAFRTEFPVDNRSYYDSNNADIMRLVNVSRGMMRLLVYSILWRASVCSLEMYKHFTLGPEVEEILRTELDSVLTDTEPGTLAVCDTYSNSEPTFPYVMLASAAKTDETGNMIATFNLENGRALILANEFMMQVFLDGQVSPSASGFNIRAQCPEVGLFSPAYWRSFVGRIARTAAEHRAGNMGLDA